MNRFRLVLLALAVVVAALAATLRPDAFSSGDSGVKLIATRAALDNPRHPFNIPLPTIAGEPTPHVEPFFSVHGDHAHAVTSPIFPLLSAPLLAALGMRGLYILPALGWLMTLAGVAALANATGVVRPRATVAIIAALGAPFLYYGLEFWEHMPAVACATLAATALLTGRPFLSGLLFGGAVLLRPEVMWFGAALVSALPLLERRPSVGQLALVAVGIAVLCAPYEVYVFMHMRTLLPLHVAVNSGGVVEHWWAGRMSLATVWFTSLGNTGFWIGAPCAVVALVALVRPARADHRFLWATAVVTSALTVLTAPNDGGSPWSPRYLLLAYVPLVVMAADVLDEVGRHLRAGRAAVVLLCVTGLWISRNEYRTLRGAKNMSGQVVDFVAENTVESQAIVTDVWWLDQLAASAFGERPVFYAPESETGAALIKRLSDSTVPVVHVIRSTTESINTSSWREGTCYFEERRNSIAVRNLVSIQLRHRCGQQSP